MKQLRHLHLVGATGTIRTAVYDSREHLVVPVVAMVEGVVWATNSDVPEFVPAEELAETPYQWNGRGCFAGHPEDGGTQITANTPRTLEKSFGLVFDAADAKRILATRRLELSAWLDPAKAEQVGPAAADVVRRLRAGETVEVSVGCYVDAEQKDGTYDGKTYHSIWRSIVSDHLAFLAADEEGACSVTAGCGAGRRAVRHLITAEGIRREGAVAEPKKTMKARVAAFLKTLQEDPAEEMAEDTAELIGYNTMSSLIDQAVVALGDASKTVAALLLDENAESTGDEEAEEAVEVARLDSLRTQCMTVYSLLGGVMEMCWTMQQDEEDDVQSVYVVNAAKRVAADAKTKVDPSTLLAKLQKALGAKPCACGGQPRQAATPPTEKESEIMEKMKERIAALMANPFNKVKEQKTLESIASLNEDAFVALESQCAAQQATAEKLDQEARDNAAKLAAAASKPTVTEEEAMKMFPRLAAAAAREEAREAAEKDALVASLKTCGAMPEEQLKTKTVDELKTLASFAKVAQPSVDFSGLGTPRVTQAEGDDLTPPNSYDAGLKALREKSTVN